MSKEQLTKDHKGEPSGTNKSEGNRLSSTMQNQNLEVDEEMTEKYIDGEDKVAANVHKMHPNRNNDKDEPIDRSGFQG